MRTPRDFAIKMLEVSWRSWCGSPWKRQATWCNMIQRPAMCCSNLCCFTVRSWEDVSQEAGKTTSWEADWDGDSPGGAARPKSHRAGSPRFSEGTSKPSKNYMASMASKSFRFFSCDKSTLININQYIYIYIYLVQVGSTNGWLSNCQGCTNELGPVALSLSDLLLAQRPQESWS